MVNPAKKDAIFVQNSTITEKGNGRCHFENIFSVRETNSDITTVPSKYLVYGISTQSCHTGANQSKGSRSSREMRELSNRFALFGQ